MPGKRTPALEYRWFKTDLTVLKDRGKGTEIQEERKKEFGKLNIAGVKLNEVTDLGLAYAPIPFINWLGLYDYTVSGEKLEQANKKGTNGTAGEELDHIVRSRLASVDNIEVMFAKGIEIISGKIAASQVKAGDKLDVEKYETKQFSIGFPGELTVTAKTSTTTGDKTTTTDTGKPLFPVIDSKTKNKSETRSKGISKTLFEAWLLQLPAAKYEKIAGIRMTTRSKANEVSPKFPKDFFQNGALLPEGFAPTIIDAEIISEPLFLPPSRSQLYLPAGVSVDDKLFEDLI